MDEELSPEMQRLKEWSERTNEIATDLLKQQPHLHPITASVIANDILSADHRTKQVEAGEAKAEDVVWLIGSFARWDWAVTMVALGRLTDEWFAKNIADLWRGSDPDDTSKNNLIIWRRAVIGNGGMIRDGRPLPKPGPDGMITVYRGGHPATIRDGFAWTTDPKIAKKFAATLGGRVTVAGGIVISGKVRPSTVLAYLTGRGESEVIVPPNYVNGMRQVGV